LSVTIPIRFAGKQDALGWFRFCGYLFKTPDGPENGEKRREIKGYEVAEEEEEEKEEM